MTTRSDQSQAGDRGTSVQRLTLVLDLVGCSALVLGAFVIWPPLALFVLGAVALIASWRLSS